MREDTIEAMIALATRALSRANSDQCRSLVRDMAGHWPDAPALSISFALATAAAEVGDNFACKGDQIGYRLSALVAADIFALEAMGKCPATAHDLLHFWRRVDPYFLKL
ncbi:MAG: putative membrane-anchored protein [Halocynthiibacter sp.]|jgi:uncharacterized membrane-anchored protein